MLPGIHRNKANTLPSSGKRPLEIEPHAAQAVDSSSSKRTRPIDLHAMPVDVSHGFNLPRLAPAGGMFMSPYTPPVLPAEYGGVLSGLSGPSADMFQHSLVPNSALELAPAPLLEPAQLPATPYPLSRGWTNPFALPSELPDESPEESLEELLAYFLEPETPPPVEANTSAQSASSMADSAPDVAQPPRKNLLGGRYALETVQEVACHFLAGKSVSEVKAVTGISMDTLCKWKKKLDNGVPPEQLNLRRQVKRMYSAETVQQACALLQQGEQLYRVSRLYGNIPRTTLCGWKSLLNQGKTPEQISANRFKAARQYSPETVQQAQVLFNQGERVSAVSSRLNIPETTLYSWKKRLGQGETPEQISSQTPGDGKFYSAETRQQVQNLIKQGEQISNISKMLKIPEKTLYGWRKKLNLQDGETGQTSSPSRKVP